MGRLLGFRFRCIARSIASAMPAAVGAGGAVAGALGGSECDGLALELLALSLAVFLLRHAVVLYANHLIAGLIGLHAAVSGDGRSSGLDGAAIARLPCLAHVRVRRIDGEEDDTAERCAVCLAALEEGETVRALPCCRHAFHPRCVDAWLRLRATCPVCRGACW